MQNIVK